MHVLAVRWRSAIIEIDQISQSFARENVQKTFVACRIFVGTIFKMYQHILLVGELIGSESKNRAGGLNGFVTQSFRFTVQHICIATFIARTPFQRSGQRPNEGARLFGVRSLTATP